MIDFIKKGNNLEGVSLLSKLKEVIKEKGEPNNLIGNDERGYIYYDNYRYNYDSNGVIDELAIDFTIKDVKFKFNNLISSQYDVTIRENFIISSSTKINKFILFLNFLNISWTSYNEKNLDYFTLRTESGVLIFFSLHSGKIIRISSLIN